VLVKSLLSIQLGLSSFAFDELEDKESETEETAPPGACHICYVSY